MDIPITLVVPTYNKSTRLVFLLESLTHQAFELGFNTIIVDDGSTDDTKEVLDKYIDNFRFKYIYQKNSGRSHARNLGLSHVKTKYSIFVDDDMILPPEFIQMHFNSLKKNENKLVHGKIWNLPFLSFFSDPTRDELIDGGETHFDAKYLRKYLISLDSVKNHSDLIKQRRLSLQEKYLEEIYDKKIDKLDFMLCTGNNFSCETDALLRVGGFDEKIDAQWGVEDIELGYRLKQNGFAFIYDHSAYNYHICHFRKTYKEELMSSFKLFYEKHKDEIILNIPKLLLREIKNLEEFKKQYIL